MLPLTLCIVVTNPLCIPYTPQVRLVTVFDLMDTLYCTDMVVVTRVVCEPRAGNMIGIQGVVSATIAKSYSKINANLEGV
jgi:hypothetical protein